MTPEEELSQEPPRRILSIDVFRGISVLLMVFVNSLQLYENVPWWTKHAGDYGLTYVDLVAPFFVFVLALTFNTSYKRRIIKFGKRKTWLRYIRRFLIFIGLGLILTMYADANQIYLRWGTLQVLGMSGLLLLPVIELKPYWKLIVAIVFMSVHQIFLFTPLNITIYNSLEGGILGSFSWGAMMIFSSFLAEGLTKEKKYVARYFISGGLTCIITGIATAFFFGISRKFISIPYILVSVGIASVLYCLLHYIYDVWFVNSNFLKKELLFSAVGKNAFLFYLIHIVIAYIVFIILPPSTLSTIVFTIAILHVLVIWFVAYILNKKKIYLVL